MLATKISNKFNYAQKYQHSEFHITLYVVILISLRNLRLMFDDNTLSNFNFFQDLQKLELEVLELSAYIKGFT